MGEVKILNYSVKHFLKSTAFTTITLCSIHHFEFLEVIAAIEKKKFVPKITWKSEFISLGVIAVLSCFFQSQWRWLLYFHGGDCCNCQKMRPRIWDIFFKNSKIDFFWNFLMVFQLIWPSYDHIFLDLLAFCKYLEPKK